MSTTTIDNTEIKFDRITKDFAILVDGVAVAYGRNYSDAEAKRTAYLADRDAEGLAATATELDGDCEIEIVLAEARTLQADIDAAMTDAAAALQPYEYRGVVVYPEHCEPLLKAIDSSNFNYEVGEGRNRGSRTATPLAKWRKCNAKNRRALALVRKELTALLVHPLHLAAIAAEPVMVVDVEYAPLGWAA